MESLLLGLGLAIVGVFLPFYFLRLLSTPALVVGRVFALLALTGFICGGFWYFQPEHKPASLAGKAGALAAVLAGLTAVVALADFVVPV